MEGGFYPPEAFLGSSDESSQHTTDEDEDEDMYGDDHQGGSTKRMRTSCDMCTSRKVKCDGLMPRCSNCVRKDHHCNYSMKKKSGPKSRPPSSRNHHPHGNGTAKGMLVPWATGYGSNGQQQQQGHLPYTMAPQARSVFMHPGGDVLGFDQHIFAPNALTPSGQVSLSGLFGSAEGGFLDCFFGQLNSFLPITDEGMVRNALVRLLSGGQLPLQSIAPRSDALNFESDKIIEDVQLQNSQNAVLWGAVAIGALLSNNWNIKRYMNVAWVSFKECFDYPSEYTVSAALIMSVLFRFLDETPRHRRFLRMASDMAAELDTLSLEVQAVINLIRLEVACETHMAESLREEVMSMEAPRESPRLRVIQYVCRVMSRMIQNKQLNEAAAEMGAPPVELNVPSFIHELATADRLLTEQSFHSSAAGLLLVRGLYTIMQFFTSGDIDQAMERMDNVLEAVTRVPIIMRFHPGWHLVHSLGILYLAGGRQDKYAVLQQAQTRLRLQTPTSQDTTGCQLGQMPLPGEPLEGFCSHTLCKVMLHITRHLREGVGHGPHGGGGDYCCTTSRTSLATSATEITSESFTSSTEAGSIEEAFLSDDDADFLSTLVADPDHVDESLFLLQDDFGGGIVGSTASCSVSANTPVIVTAGTGAAHR